jgi:hypothetical protein
MTDFRAIGEAYNSNSPISPRPFEAWSPDAIDVTHYGDVTFDSMTPEEIAERHEKNRIANSPCVLPPRKINEQYKGCTIHDHKPERIQSIENLDPVFLASIESVPSQYRRFVHGEWVSA